MNSGTRREIEELVTLHELEPGLPEILVEGRSDAFIVEMVLEELGLEAAVFAIGDRVELPNDAVVAQGFDAGERGRVIATATIVAEKYDGDDVTFIADADFEYLDPLVDPLSNLLFTDYSSMDLYGFNSKVLGKFLKVGLRAPDDVDSEKILSAITKGLQSMFLCRWKLKKCSPSPGLVDKVLTRCKIKDNAIVVDVGKLLRDSVNSCAEPGARNINSAQLHEEVETLLSKLQGDRRQYIHGHDYAKVLVYYLAKSFSELFKEDRTPFKQVTATEISLRLCLEPKDLIGEKMFSALKERVLVSTSCR